MSKNYKTNKQIILIKPVVIQLPIYTYDNSFYIVETEVALPQDYTPQKGSFFAHDCLPNIGRLNIDWWGYDGRDHKTYIALGVGYHDPTRNIDEWLQSHAQWKLAEDPMLSIKERNADSFEEEGEEDYLEDQDDFDDPDW